jgi:MutS domain V
VSPTEEYVRRLKARESQVAQYEKIHIRLGNIRLAVAILACVIAWFAFRLHSLSPYWLALPIAVFVGIASSHSRILRARDRACRATVFYKNGLARIEDRWSENHTAPIGETGERFNDPHHVYAADLDLFGNGSLFQLLSTARTRMGEETLAKWLLTPSPVDAIRERHACVCELRDQLDLREDLAVLGENEHVGVNPEALKKWAEAENLMRPIWLRWLAPLLAGLLLGSVGVWAYGGFVTPLVLVVVVEAVITYRLREALEHVFHGAENALGQLDLLSDVLARVEEQRFDSPRLQALQHSLLSGTLPSSRAIAKLRTLVSFIDSRHNLFVRIIDAPLMYSVQVAFAAERWRRAHGQDSGSWLTTIGEIEGLLSLSTYSFEHPSDPFPEFVDGRASFDAEALGHPLIPRATCVRNHVSITGDTRLLLVSGSNMSGKSTQLRAVGLNVVLAMAGAPVRARRLRLAPLQVGASIRVNDSLQEGSSRFYTEITRLRKIFDLAAGDPPLIFLLDELLQGTNSNDRRVGAEGIVRALLNRGAIGLVSTHDLALTDIGGALNAHVRNVHFQDELSEGRMTFDYILRDGVVTKSNGLELMRSIGLEV